MADCQGCTAMEQIKELDRKYSESRKEIYRRIETLERASAVANEKFDRILSEIKKSNEEIEKIGEQIKKLSEVPAKRWDSAMQSGLSAIVGGIIGLVISRFFGG